jgi:two-component system response regulator CpxR
MGRLLVIDQDREGWESLNDYLVSAGFRVEYAINGVAGYERALDDNFDLILLDSMLPGENSFELLGRLSSLIPKPIIVVAKGVDDVDMIVCLEMGADDYLVKPVNPRELVARIRAVLRRAGSGANSESLSKSIKIVVGDVEIDTGTRVVNRSGEQVELTSVEFGLLQRLLRNAGKPVSREHLINEVLGRSLSPADRSIDVHISKLRKKLGSRMYGIERIRTIRGEGYLYAVPSSLVCDVKGAADHQG